LADFKSAADENLKRIPERFLRNRSKRILISIKTDELPSKDMAAISVLADYLNGTGAKKNGLRIK